MDPIQEAAEESNKKIMNLIDATRIVLDYGCQKVDDEWYKRVMFDLAEVLFYLGSLVGDLNYLTYPVYPGKYTPIMNVIKEKLLKELMTEDDIKNLAVSMNVPVGEVNDLIELIHNDEGFYNRNRDCRKQYDEGVVRDLVQKIAKEHGVSIERTLCNNPYGKKVEVKINNDETTRICDAIRFKKKLESELQTEVTVYIGDGHELQELPY